MESASRLARSDRIGGWGRSLTPRVLERSAMPAKGQRRLFSSTPHVDRGSPMSQRHRAQKQKFLPASATELIGGNAMRSPTGSMRLPSRPRRPKKGTNTFFAARFSSPRPGRDCRGLCNVDNSRGRTAQPRYSEKGCPIRAAHKSRKWGSAPRRCRKIFSPTAR